MNTVNTKDIDCYLLFSKLKPPKTEFIEKSEDIDIGFQSIVLPHNLKSACEFLELNHIEPLSPYVMVVLKKGKETIL